MVALAKTLAAGESTGYGRRFVAAEPTRIGIVPVGYADGFRRDITGAEVRRRRGARTRRRNGVDGRDRRRVPAAAGEGDAVTLVGDGVLIEEHAGSQARFPMRSPAGSSRGQRDRSACSSMSDVVGYRLAAQEERAEGLRARVQQLLAPFDGTERALDSGCGAGALAFALAPFVESVVGVDLSEELVAAGKELAPPNCELVVGDATALPSSTARSTSPGACACCITLSGRSSSSASSRG